MRGEHDTRSLRNLVCLFDEDSTAFGQGFDDMPVVHDLLAHVYRRTEMLKRTFDGDDRPIDTGTVATRSGEQHPLLGIGGPADIAGGHTPARNRRSRY